VPQRGTEATMLLVFNAHHDLVEFTLPVPGGGGCWQLVLDTNIPEHTGGFEGAPGDRYGATARSLVMFALVS
jgi:isoamylase